MKPSRPKAITAGKKGVRAEGFEIARYHKDDFETLWRIDQQCFAPEVAYSRQALSSYINHKLAITWVARKDSAIIGFVLVGREPRNIGHIITLDVVEQARRWGVGSALMKTAEDWAAEQGLDFLYLETAEDNWTAQRFYAARGYAKVDEIPEYYSTGQTAWVMVKWL